MKKNNKKVASKSTTITASNSYVQQVIDALSLAANETGKSEREVTKNEVMEYATDYALKRAGNLNAVKNAYFPLTGKDLAGIQRTKDEKSYIDHLEKTIGKTTLLSEEIKQIVTTNFKPISKIKPTSLKQKTKNPIKREMVAMLNDTHIGVVVDPEEINNANSFDFKEAGRRFAFFAKEVSNYKLHARSETKKLHLILNGDLIAGIIHGLATRSIHLLTHQMNAAIHIFGHTIGHLAKDFNEIEVHGIAGNHCRMVHKEGGKRAVAEVYDSYANIIFYALSAMFQNNKQISFNFPKTPYGFINLPAGRAMYAHGDHIFSKYLGNPGTTINVKSLSSAIKDFNAGELAQGRDPVKLILFAHVHVFAHFITNDGVEVYISPSLSGLDQFAHSLTINNNFIAQPVFESTKDYIMGDSRLIRLNKADNDATLDKIIPEYKKELKWKKG